MKKKIQIKTYLMKYPKTHIYKSESKKEKKEIYAYDVSYQSYVCHMSNIYIVLHNITYYLLYTQMLKVYILHMTHFHIFDMTYI